MLRFKNLVKKQAIVTLEKWQKFKLWVQKYGFLEGVVLIKPNSSVEETDLIYGLTPTESCLLTEKIPAILDKVTKGRVQEVIFIGPSIDKPKWYQFWKWHLYSRWKRESKEASQKLIEALGTTFKPLEDGGFDKIKIYKECCDKKLFVVRVEEPNNTLFTTTSQDHYHAYEINEKGIGKTIQTIGWVAEHEHKVINKSISIGRLGYHSYHNHFIEE